MARLGADVEQLEQLSKRFRDVAQQITQMTQQLSGQIEAAWWEGSDAERFRGEWNGTYRGQLQNVASRLEETATAVNNQANQQRQTSGA